MINKTRPRWHRLTNLSGTDLDIPRLSAEDAKLFVAALDKPPAPTPRALKAAAAYRRRVANAD
ncbi:MAG: DUF1778 domain-containing protein [Gammaproteobacteria bacterium]|nr:DUF1778 domain-containing protein [Gammaproteobacteria bacterium]MDE0284297.1 DUF1778 domain-containing protein [Gammaproteobacteria bacterium]MDE0510327.1 DUF1778 domain-containing protein [Gammaproteobacteria bacterium]